jgi:nucleoside-diphosphate-sugar epimerase
MLHELLPDVPVTVFRPSIVMGDSRNAQTTQFDMVRAFVSLAEMPFLPFRSEWRADIVPADYVGRAISTIHMKEKPKYDTYHLSAGTSSLSYKEIVQALAAAGMGKRPPFLPSLETPFSWLVNLFSIAPRHWKVSRIAALIKVFLPYLTFNTVFDNSRVVEELGEAPAKFDTYAFSLLKFSKENRFTFPYQALPKQDDKRRMA